MPRTPLPHRLYIVSMSLAASLFAGQQHAYAGFDWVGKIERQAAGLRSKAPDERLKAVRGLGQYSGALIKSHLLKRLSDPDVRVRHEAARVLGSKKVVDAVPILIEWLGASDPAVKQIAATTLGEIGSPDATRALIRTLADPAPDTRVRAVKALGKIASPKVVVPLIGRLEDDKASVRVTAVEELRKIGDPRAVLPIVRAFDDPSVKVRRAAVSTVGELGDASPWRALVRRLRDLDEQTRRAAVVSLGKLAVVDATNQLIARFHRSTNHTFRAQIAYTLGQIARVQGGSSAKKSRAIRTLVEALASPGLRSAAKEAITVAGTAAVPFLLAHLSGELQGDPETAVELLRDIGDARVVDVLITELDRGRVSQSLLLQALSRSGDRRAVRPMLIKLSNSDERTRLELLELLTPLLRAGDRSADILIELLESKNRQLLIKSVELLGLTRSRAAVPRLLELGKPGQPESVRLAVIAALGNTRDKRATSLLLDIVEHSSTLLQRAAADALIHIADQSKIDSIIRRLKSASPQTQHRLVRVLGGIARDTRHAAAEKLLEDYAKRGRLRLSLAAIAGLAAMRASSSLATLRELARAYDPHRRRAALEALGTLKDNQALPVLLEALKRPNDDRIRGTAAWALGKLSGKKALAALVLATRNAGWSTATNATAAIARRVAPQDQDTIASLIRLTLHRHKLVRVNAVWGLGRLREASAGTRFRKLLARDPSWLVRKNAADALSRLSAKKGDPNYLALRAASTKDDNEQVRRAATRALEREFNPPTRSEWRNYHFVGPNGQELPLVPYFVYTADGLAAAIYSDARGQAAEENVPAGQELTVQKAALADF